MKHWSTLLSSIPCPYMLPSWEYWLAWGPADLVLRPIFVHKTSVQRVFFLFGNKSHLTSLDAGVCLVVFLFLPNPICSSRERAKLCWSFSVSGCVGLQDGPGCVCVWSRILISCFSKPSKPTITSLWLYYAPDVSFTFFIPEQSFWIGMIYTVRSTVEVRLLCSLSLP